MICYKIQFYAIRFLFLMLLVSLTNYVSAQKLSKQEQIADLKNYVKVLKKKHIGLYRYTPKKEMNTFLDSIVCSVSDSCTHGKFYKRICKINARIRCGHTKVEYPDDIMFSKESFIPFNLFSIGNKFYIYKNKTFPYLPIESKQLISINDILIDSIVNKIKEYLPADGYIETGKNIQIKEFFWRNYAQFIDKNSYHKVVILDSIGKFDTLNIKSLKIKDLIRDDLRNKNRENNNFIKFHIDSTNNYAYVGVNSFLIKEKIFKRRLKNVFSKINEKKTQNLVIDLRGNGGGYTNNSNLLLSYLIRDKVNVPLKRFIRERTKDKDWGKKKIKPKSKPYTGNLYFLMDGSSFSAASLFLAIAQYLKLGVFVGEETGGAKDGCNSGGYKYELPNSKLVCYIPMQKSVFTKPLLQKGRGVFPDYPIVYSKDDIINNKDLCILKVINLIKKNNAAIIK